MNHFIKKAETYARQIKGLDIDIKEKMLIDKFKHVLTVETCKHIANTF